MTAYWAERKKKKQDIEMLLECVPNFSEGRDGKVIRAIADSIAGVNGVKLLGCEAGQGANRSVMTFAGEPSAVCEAAFRSVKTAGELIDMRLQHGTHPRTGACDVLPLVPIDGITLQECAKLARDLARRIWEELGIPCNLYEAAALKEERKNLAVCRQGQYEALPQRLSDPKTRPDFSPNSYNERVARSGVCNVGARKFLVAVNFNLNSRDVGVAKRIALRVREKGYRAKDASTDGVLYLNNGEWWKRGLLPGCKAIGWYIEEYGIAQVSMNITDTDLTPLHVAFETVSRVAQEEGVKVTGTEIIGLVPLGIMLDAGKHFSEKADSSPTVKKESELIDIARRAMNLDQLAPFDAQCKILEYALKGDGIFSILSKNP